MRSAPSHDRSPASTASIARRSAVPPPRYNPFDGGRLGRVDGLIERFLETLQPVLGHSSDTDHGNAAGQLGESFLELVLVIVRGRVFDLSADLVTPLFDGNCFASPADDHGGVLVDHDAVGGPEILERHVFEFDAEVSGDHHRAGQDGDVIECCPALIAEAGSPDLFDCVGDECTNLGILLWADTVAMWAVSDLSFTEREMGCSARTATSQPRSIPLVIPIALTPTMTLRSSSANIAWANSVDVVVPSSTRWLV